MSAFPASRGAGAKRGFVLILSLLLILALAVIATSVAALGAREALMARQMVRLTQARLDAEGAARMAAARWSTRERLAAEQDGRAAEDLDATHRLDVRAERLGPGFFLVTARARLAPGGGLSRSAGLLLHALEPPVLLALFPAALAASGTARIEAGLLAAGPLCGSSSRVPALQGEDVLIGAEATVDGAVLPGPPPPFAPSDPLAPPLLITLADISVGPGETVPQPRHVGAVCEPSPSNWGAISSASPCHDLLPLIRAEGPLTLDRGEGRGILVVDGDLHLRGSFRFHGLLLVRGQLTLREDARLEGAVRAGTVHAEGGRVRFDGCEAEAAASAPALDRAFRPPGRWWIPPF